MICSTVAEIWEEHYRPAYLQALVFKLMFLNLPHCDGLKRLNRAEPQYQFHIGGLSTCPLVRDK